ncbi:MAG: hypothetical protein GWO07_09605 [Candidatus Dadabacteria bacterium]|nr:hypothetical protein [Candidatus Dadabacteria bacterium]NIS09002.1 hypothetical protein [Candidatus Dadabacteria bacterium]NIV41045.1 hypothetical protein [Candidatus Dadabacteria bacterium]NIX15605.1 hypothetical protein [Candidatus Dadabacteria bacterium]NIY22346.1 hypothetical protein [Candidatus Dadabacteria bacterium]
MGNSAKENLSYLYHKYSEKLQYYLFINHWPARLAYKFSLQGKVSLKKYHVRLDNYPKNKDSIKIAFASDFHLGPTSHIKHIKKSIDLIRSLSPDVLLLGGDIVFIKPEFVDPFAELMSELKDIKRIYFVIGNHDYLAGSSYVVDALENVGLKSLVNDYELLDSGFDFISVHGIDDYDFGKADPEKAFAGSNGVRIVLMHSPSSYSDIADYEFDIAFCGHTHAGQIALRGGKPIITARGPYCKEYNYGKFAVGKNENKNLIVTSGVGYGWLPFRINTNSEVVLCEVSGQES